MLPREDLTVSRVVEMSLGEDMVESADRGKNSHGGHAKVPVEMPAYSLTSHMSHLQISLQLGVDWALGQTCTSERALAPEDSNNFSS